MKAMNSRLRLWSGVGLLAGALLLAPQAAAHASTAHSMTMHTIPVKVVGMPRGLASRDQASAWIHPASTETYPVSPRLSLSGCSRQDGFNGNVQVANSSIAPFYNIKIWGEAWDLCGADAEVYLSWQPGNNNPNVGSSGYNYTSGVNWGPQVTALPYNITVTVCANWANKWRCGTPYPANGGTV